jgi:hypothetical protein
MKLHELIKNKLWYLNGATNRTSLSRWSTMIRRIHLAHSFKTNNRQFIKMEKLKNKT